ncbi:MAG: helix-turn-helix transcriptional regulator [Galbitalea sp.]
MRIEASQLRTGVHGRDQLSTDEWEQRVGQQLRRLRLDAGLDQAGLAESAAVSVGAVRNLERGAGSTLKTLVRVVRALDPRRLARRHRPPTWR